MTRKLDYHDHNGHIARNIFHCYTMISSLAKVMYMGLQSNLFLEKTEDQNCYLTQYMVLGLENAFTMTAVIILVISLIIFKIGSLKLMLVATNIVFCG